MSGVKIEKGVPIPPQQYRGGRPKTSPIHQLDVGDSFVIDNNDSEPAFRACASRIGFKVQIGFDQAGNRRIWRIA